MQGVFLDLLDAKPRDANVLVLDNRRHNVASDGFVVAVGIHTQENLLLQFQKFATRRFVGAKLLDKLVVFGKNLVEILVGKGECKTHQRPLATNFISGATIDLEKHFEFRDVGHSHRREHHGTDEQRRVAIVDGRREQQFGVERFFARTPLVRRQKAVEKRIQQLQMLVVKGLQARFGLFIGFEREHREVLHITFEHLAHGVVVVGQVGMVLRSCTESGVRCLQFSQFKVAEQVGHTAQERAIDLLALVVAIAVQHKVAHPLIVRLQIFQPLPQRTTHDERIFGENGSQTTNGSTHVAFDDEFSPDFIDFRHFLLFYLFTFSTISSLLPHPSHAERRHAEISISAVLELSPGSLRNIFRQYRRTALLHAR